jgi:hypothetical protein
MDMRKHQERRRHLERREFNQEIAIVNSKAERILHDNSYRKSKKIHLHRTDGMGDV